MLTTLFEKEDLGRLELTGDEFRSGSLKGFRLGEMLQAFPDASSQGNIDLEIESIEVDSRKVLPGSLFVAVKKFDESRPHIEDAIKRGAGVIISSLENEKFLRSLVGEREVSVIGVLSPRHVWAWFASRKFDFPASKLALTGVSGTNAKTSVTYLLENAFKNTGCKTGVIGTIETRYGNFKQESSHTTPDSMEICQTLAEMVENGVSHCFMEVSSHGLSQDRVRELDFEVAVFTNFSQDHLDYHKDMEEYKRAKMKLFLSHRVRKQVVNIDDPVGREILAASNAETMTTGFSPKADIQAEKIILNDRGVSFELGTPWGSTEIQSSLLGEHAVSNMLSAAAASLLQGISLDDVALSFASLKKIPGRMEKVDGSGDTVVLVDYAHTPDALDNALNAVSTIAKNKVWVVFGCGGDRDRDKRSKMGSIAYQKADRVIVTSDNPRSEDPETIIDDILAGLPKEKQEDKVQVILNRQEALSFSIQNAQAGDIVLIAGKGHETYQLVGDQVLPFDDREIARQALDDRGEAC